MDYKASVTIWLPAILIEQDGSTEGSKFIFGFGSTCATRCNFFRRTAEILGAEFKLHLTPKFFFSRDETVQHSHKEFDNFISSW